MEVNLGALARGKAAPFRFIAAAPVTGAVFDLSARTGDGFAIESLFRGLKPGAAIRLDAADLGDAGTVTLSERDPATLPPLLPRQVALGPAVHVASDRSPASGARLRLPYLAKAVRAAKLAPADLVVLALDDKQTRYRELRPVAVDENGATLTVVTDTFSTFFPGSPGIRIDAPRFYVSAIGERVGYSSALELMVSGEVTDDRAIVEVDGVVATRAGRAFGRGSIPLPFAGDRVVEVTARLPDVRPHTVSFAVRRQPPAKRVALGSPLYGHELAVDTANRPYVSYGTAIGPAGGAADDVEAFVAGDWNRLLSQYGHRLARTQLGDSEVSWTSIDITEPAELHEELAASVIAEYQRLSIPGAPPIRLAAADPIATRAIRSIAAFIAEHGDNFTAIAALYGVFRLRWPTFALGVMTYSPTAPVAVLPDGVTLGATYVHATEADRDAAQASGVGNRLREMFVRATPVAVTVTNAAGEEERVIQDMPLEPTAVAAGRLMYVEMSPYVGDGRTRSERVAEGIWCSRIALEVDPRTGQPVIAAIGVAADLDGVGPRSRLLMYRRQVDGRWTETLIDDQSAYVDVDLALETDGDPRLVAGVAAAGGGFRLVEITAAGTGWSVQPLLWSLPGIAASNIGACPRIVIDSGNRSVVAFVADESASPRYVAGIKRAGRWSFLGIDALQRHRPFRRSTERHRRPVGRPGDTSERAITLPLRPRLGERAARGGALCVWRRRAARGGHRHGPGVGARSARARGRSLDRLRPSPGTADQCDVRRGVSRPVGRRARPQLRDVPTDPLLQPGLRPVSAASRRACRRTDLSAAPIPSDATVQQRRADLRTPERRYGQRHLTVRGVQQRLQSAAVSRRGQPAALVVRLLVHPQQTRRHDLAAPAL